MAAIQMKELLEAGVHFGHQTKRWNPKMKKYIFGARNSIYIIDLQKTLRLWNTAANFLTKAASEGKTFLFVATKPQAQELIAEQAQRCGAFYVNNRWLGGMLTNFATIKKSLDKLRDIEATLNDPARTAQLSKKEILNLNRAKAKLEASFAGIRDMRNVPDVIFVIDPHREDIAITEAAKLGIKIVGLVDTNCDPDKIDYVIPANDDAIRSILLFSERVADSVLEGRQSFQDKGDNEQMKAMMAEKMNEGAEA
ncbi:30S ribosomal protein S2 [Mesoterricola sediminis]|uniref:Small ribosomal subunit protein uS2 n=1 Tax=Mesoterricola sediminis TaxID=2927980 RepID=A0AA48H488_9BACT|nr:30S ribosomal protein S2 [Mesoterricola sediminis]BDU75703.1 30S ribosomal protein S2 [Mesoterricola sediminis]